MRMIKAATLILGLCIFQFVSLRLAGFSPSISFMDVWPLFVLMVALSNILLVTQRYYHSSMVFNTANSAMVILFATVTLSLNYTVVVLISGASQEYYEYFSITFFYRALLVGMTYFICLMFFWVEEQKIRQRKLREFAIEKEREAVQIELRSIQQQFKPHFLFNSLNSISALTLSNPKEARKMILLLSQFMRGIVRENQSEKVNLSEEIKHIQLYTDIEKVRFGSRLTVAYDISDDAEELQLPALILQPIIENAVKYGIYGQTDKVTISLTARAEKNALVITITNPFDKELQPSVKGTGYGLHSIEKKMLILYNQANLLSLSEEDGTFTTTLKIPQL